MSRSDPPHAPTSLLEVETQLRLALAGPLPGAAAQRRFAPTPIRDDWSPDLRPSTAREAGTIVLIYAGAHGPTIPLTVRHAKLPLHAGQVSLPGGALDPGESPQAAALRETDEEIGLPADRVRIVGALSTLWVEVSNFIVHPFVGIVDDAPEFRLHPDEVETILHVPLADLCDRRRVKWSHRERGGIRIEYPYFDVADHVVWGATAMMLGEFISLFGARGSGLEA